MYDKRQTKAAIMENFDKALAEISRLRNTLYEVTTNGEWTDGEQCGDWRIAKEVYETARDALIEPSPRTSP